MHKQRGKCILWDSIKGSLMGHEQGGVEQLVNLYQVSFHWEVGFSYRLKVRTGHSRNRTQQKDLEQGEKFRTILLHSWWPPKSAVLDGSEAEGGVDVLAQQVGI